jgi:nucleosome binding factor SPN SPT16 subunit
MKFERRVRLLDTLLAAHEASAEAIRIVLEQEPVSELPPPNVIKEANKTGPRLPFVMPAERPSQKLTKPDTTYAINKHTSRGHLARMSEEARTDEDRAHVRRLAERMRKADFITAAELARYLANEKPEK